MKRFCFLIFCFLLLLTVPAFAHSGGTDSYGGHYDSSTGIYHYHHGYPAHEHIDGTCPYDFDNKTGLSSGTSSGSSSAVVKSSSSTSEVSPSGIPADDHIGESNSHGFDDKTGLSSGTSSAGSSAVVKSSYSTSEVSPSGIPVPVFLISLAACFVLTLLFSHRSHLSEKKKLISTNNSLSYQNKKLLSDLSEKDSRMQLVRQDCAKKVREAEQKTKRAESIIANETRIINTFADKKAAQTLSSLLPSASSISDTIAFSALSSDHDPAILKRLTSAKTEDLLLVSAPQLSADIKSAHGNTVYHVTLNSCTCPDFQNRHIPCKHMFRLALSLLPPSEHNDTDPK